MEVHVTQSLLIGHTPYAQRDAIAEAIRDHDSGITVLDITPHSILLEYPDGHRAVHHGNGLWTQWWNRYAAGDAVAPITIRFYDSQIDPDRQQTFGRLNGHSLQASCVHPETCHPEDWDLDGLVCSIHSDIRGCLPPDCVVCGQNFTNHWNC